MPDLRKPADVARKIIALKRAERKLLDSMRRRPPMPSVTTRARARKQEKGRQGG